MSDGLGRSWDGLGQFLANLWTVLGGLGVVSERSWGDLGAVLAGLGLVSGVLWRPKRKLFFLRF